MFLFTSQFNYWTPYGCVVVGKTKTKLTDFANVIFKITTELTAEIYKVSKGLSPPPMTKLFEERNEHL